MSDNTLALSVLVLNENSFSFYNGGGGDCNAIRPPGLRPVVHSADIRRSRDFLREKTLGHTFFKHFNLLQQPVSTTFFSL